MKKRSVAYAVLFLLVVSPHLNADTIYLKNGHSIVGEIVQETEDAVEIDIGGGTVIQNRAGIASIEKTDESKTVKTQTFGGYSSSKKKLHPILEKIKKKWEEMFPKRTKAEKKGEYYYKKAMSCKRKDDIDGAFLYIEKAINSGYRTGKVYAALGALYAQKRQKAQAKRYLKIAIKMLQDDLERYQMEENTYMVKRTRLLLGSTRLQLEKAIKS